MRSDDAHENLIWPPTKGARRLLIVDFLLDLTAKTIQQSPIEEIDSGEDIKADGSIVTFIKTARKPYDRVVFAALLAIRHHVPGTRIATDDDPDDHEPEYTYGIDLYRRTFPDRDATYTPDAGK